MEKLSAKKRVAVVRQYLSGLSYGEIAAKCGVSKGMVANVAADLKAGRFPEAADAAEHIEQLRELSLDLNRLKLTPGQCAAGLLLLTRINECGLDPADIHRWPLILQSVGGGDEAQDFVRLVYGIQEVQRRTGLSLDALHDKAHDLEREAAELEPVSGKLEEYKKQISELTGQREELARTVAGLEQKYELLNPRVKELEKRERDLSHRITDMEPRAEKAEATLTTLSKEIQRLQDTGLSLEELGEFNDRLRVIAQRHHIEPAELRDRLLHELEILDKGLTLEALIDNRQQELNRMGQAITGAKKEMETVKAVVDSLKQEKTSLEASIKSTREKVGKQIAELVPVAQDTIDRLGKELRRGHDEALIEVHRLRDEAVEAGRQIGRCEGILQVNEWLNDLLALMRGEESVEGKQVSALTSRVLRGTALWLKHHNLEYSSLSSYTGNLIRELEQWKV